MTKSAWDVAFPYIDLFRIQMMPDNNLRIQDNCMQGGTTSRQEQYFLATTALENFWDTSKPILFLGEWCRRYSRSIFWEPLGGTIVNSPWADEQTLEQADEYLNDTYECLMAELAKALNSLHNTDHNERYWRILLGPWLQLYVTIMYDRLIYIQKALEAYPDFTTTVLAENSYVIPHDTSEFFKLISDDTYNLQLYSRILKSLGKNYPSKSTTVSLSDIRYPSPGFIIGSMMALKPVLNMFTSFFKKRAAILFRESYFPLSVELQLVLKAKGRVFPLLAKNVNNFKNTSLRSGLMISTESRDKFKKLLYTHVRMDIPRCYIEGYKSLSEFADCNHSHKIKALLSSISWYYDESFKFFAASSSEKGIALLGVQHGGNYGSTTMHSAEKHEITITDRYYSWGWDDPYDRKIVPMPSGKLSNRTELKADNHKKGILFVSTSSPSRYMMQLPYTHDFFIEYLSWQARFIHACSPETLNNLRVRFRWDDSGWDIQQRWKDAIPNVSVDSFDVPLTNSLEKCRLFVSDNLQTTFLEALSANKPSVLFWDDKYNKLRPEAIPYYDKLRIVGILHDSPESAAYIISTIYDDVETWWNEPIRQEARITFCQRFALKTSNSVKLWIHELENVLNDLVISVPSCMTSNV